jgi:hypothetical protein
MAGRVARGRPQELVAAYDPMGSSLVRSRSTWAAPAAFPARLRGPAAGGGGAAEAAEAGKGLALSGWPGMPIGLDVGFVAGRPPQADPAGRDRA